jgi:hypothetical protein
MKKKQSGLWVIILLAILTLLVYHDVIFKSGVVFGKDTIVQGYPLFTSTADIITGRIGQGWFPYMLSGFPMPSDELFCPTDWLMLVLPPVRAITWNYILHALTAAVFMFFLMRRFRQSTIGSFISAMAFGFSAFFISKVYAGHGGAIWTGIWIPLVILLLDRTIESRRVTDAIFTGVAFGFQLLGKHPQYLYYTAIAALLFAAWRILPQIVRARRLSIIGIYLGLAVLVILFMVLISAPYLLSFTQITLLSNRSGGTDYKFASSLSMHPAQLITAIAPSFWGNPVRHNSAFGALYWDGAMFIGVLPFLFAIIAVIWVRGPRACYFKILALISILIALGNNTPLFQLIYHIPGFSMVRAPSKILFLYTFAASALAAYGVDALLSTAIRSRQPESIQEGTLSNKKPRTALIWSSIGFITAFLFWFTAKEYVFSAARHAILASRKDPQTALAKLEGLFNLQLSGLAWAAGFAAIGAVIAVMFVRQKISARTTGIVLVLLTFIDLWMYADPLLFITDPSKPYKAMDRTAINIMKADHDHYRILPLDTSAFQYAQGVFDDLESINGYYPVSLARYAAFVGAIKNAPPYSGVSADIKRYNSPLVRLLSVKYILSSKPISDDNLVHLHSGRSNLYYNKNWLPRAFTVHHAKVVSSPKDALNEIRQPDFNPRDTIIIESDRKLPKVSGESHRDKVRIILHGSNEINIQVDMASDGYLFLSEVYYPTWKAWVNGKPADILPANYLFRGIYLSKGHHNIQMRVVDTWSNIGKVLSLSSMAFVAMVFFISYSKRGQTRGRV